MLEKKGVKRPFTPMLFHQAAVLADLGAHVVEVQPQQHGRRPHARALALAAEVLETEHALVKHHVARIDFDHVVSKAVDVMGIDIRNMNQRREHPLAHALVDGQARRFAQAPALLAQHVELVAEVFIGRQARLVVVQAQGHGADGGARRFREQGDLVERMRDAGIDGIAAPAVHLADQQAGRFAPSARIGHADMEALQIEFVLHGRIDLSLAHHQVVECARRVEGNNGFIFKAHLVLTFIGRRRDGLKPMPCDKQKTGEVPVIA